MYSLREALYLQTSWQPQSSEAQMLRSLATTGILAPVLDKVGSRHDWHIFASKGPKQGRLQGGTEASSCPLGSGPWPCKARNLLQPGRGQAHDCQESCR